MAEFRPHYDELKARGVDVVVIGSGEPRYARYFVENEKLEMPVYSDAERVTFRAAGLKRGFFRMFNPGVIAKAVKTIGKHRQRKTMGDAMQQGGILVVRPDGTVPYSYVSKYPGDHPATAQVVAEVFRAAVA